MIVDYENTPDGVKDVKITLHKLEMNGETLIRLMHILKQTEPENYNVLKEEVEIAFKKYLAKTNKA